MEPSTQASALRYSRLIQTGATVRRAIAAEVPLGQLAGEGLDHDVGRLDLGKVGSP